MAVLRQPEMVSAQREGVTAEHRGLGYTSTFCYVIISVVWAEAVFSCSHGLGSD